MVSTQYLPTGLTAREIAASLEDGIRDGALLPGEVLPAVRTLAAALGVAPGTTASAYRILRDRGVVEGRGRLGTVIRSRPPLATRSGTRTIGPDVLDLAGGQPESALLPELASGSLPAGGTAGAPGEFVLPDLAALGRERLESDGVPVPALTLTHGGLDGVSRLLSTQLRPGDAVALEDPGWPNALDLVTALGLRAFPMSLDQHGPVPPSLDAAVRAGARAVIVTSRAQNPTGSWISPTRAAQLREVLDRHPEVLLIEDDHAAELADVGLSTLAGATNRWAFVRSLSKPYGPDLRLALLAGDAATVAQVDGRMRVTAGWVSTLLQRAVLGLFAAPGTAAALDRAGKAYDHRRTSLVDALAAQGIGATGATGLNVWIPVEDETAAVTGLLERHWAVAPGARFRQASSPGIRITVSALRDETIHRLAADVAQVLHRPAGSGYST